MKFRFFEYIDNIIDSTQENSGFAIIGWYKYGVINYISIIFNLGAKTRGPGTEGQPTYLLPLL